MPQREKAFRFFGHSTMNVEILKDDQLQKIYFRVDKKVSCARDQEPTRTPARLHARPQARPPARPPTHHFNDLTVLLEYSTRGSERGAEMEHRPIISERKDPLIHYVVQGHRRGHSFPEKSAIELLHNDGCNKVVWF